MVVQSQISSDSPSFLYSAKSESAGHCHRSVWLLCQRHARVVLAERRCGEDLHEDECEWLVERRSKWQGELTLSMGSCGWVKGTGQSLASPAGLGRSLHTTEPGLWSVVTFVTENRHSRKICWTNTIMAQIKFTCASLMASYLEKNWGAF